MDNIAKEINEGIKENKVYKRYLLCKEAVENNEELNKIKERMAKIKDTNCKLRDEQLIDEYYALERKYNDNVLVQEYRSLKKEISELFFDVCDILSFK